MAGNAYNAFGKALMGGQPFENGGLDRVGQGWTGLDRVGQGWPGICIYCPTLSNPFPDLRVWETIFFFHRTHVEHRSESWNNSEHEEGHNERY